MSKLVGLERDAEGLSKAIDTITQIERAGAGEPALLNMTATAKLVATAALARKESRGGHYRSDYPATDPVGSRTFLKLADAERIVTENSTERQNRAAL